MILSLKDRTPGICKASIMSTRFTLRRLPAVAWALAVLTLSACNNQYGPPVPGQPLTWGQQHYLDNQAYQRLNQDRMP
jgi:hypothetical protein